VALATGLAAALLTIRLDDIVELFATPPNPQRMDAWRTSPRP
jgi:hypothetical protein